MNWNWQSGEGWNLQKCGDYAVTKHEPAAEGGAWTYIAWWKSVPLKGDCATADEARGVCQAHAEANS